MSVRSRQIFRLVIGLVVMVSMGWLAWFAGSSVGMRVLEGFVAVLGMVVAIDAGVKVWRSRA